MEGMLHIPVYAHKACYLHDPPAEILSGIAQTPFESPQRLTKILDALSEDEDSRQRFRIIWPDLSASAFSQDLLLRSVKQVHREEYIDFLATIYDAWCKEGGSKDAVLPETFLRSDLLLEKDLGGRSTAGAIEKAGRYSFDLSAPITADTYAAALISCGLACHTVLQIAQNLETDGARPREAFALCRPPGHHASTALCGGYCYINNVAVAARMVQGLNKGWDKVAILDIDYHHGNGTSKIFYDDPTVLYVSLHGSPDYPYFTGAETERGTGAGLGFNVNYPLPLGTGDDAYIETLKKAMDKIINYAPDILFVSLGVDTYKDDPITDFQISLEAYRRMGTAISEIDSDLPVCFIMEGGYCMDKIGACVKGVLSGFQDGRYGPIE